MPEALAEPALHQLPIEILAYIFWLSRLDRHGKVSNTRRAGPLVLTRVCRHWKTITDSDPKLWSNITIQLGAFGCTPRLPLICLHLDRSRNHALDIRISLRDDLEDYQEVDQSVMSGVLHELLREAPRWEIVDITLPLRMVGSYVDITWDDIGLKASPEMGCLRSFRMCIDGHGLVPRVFEDVLRASRLENLHWGSHQRIDLSLAKAVDWSTMRELYLDAPISVAEVMEILASTPKVSRAEFLDISSSGPNVQTAAEDRSTLQSLSHLTIAGKAKLSHLLSKIAAPSLRSFSIRVKEGPTFSDPESFHHLRDFLVSCSATLSFLDLSEVSLQQANLISLLELLPLVQELSIYESGAPVISDLFIKALTEVMVAPLCPRLVSLRLLGNVDSTDGRLGQLLRRRSKPFAIQGEEGQSVAALKTVQVEFGAQHNACSIDFAIAQEVRKLGMNIRLFSSG